MSSDMIASCRYGAIGRRLGHNSYLPRLAVAVKVLEVKSLLGGIGFGSWLRPEMANIAELKFVLHGQICWQTTASHWIRFVQRPRSSYGPGTHGRLNPGVGLTTRHTASPEWHIPVAAQACDCLATSNECCSIPMCLASSAREEENGRLAGFLLLQSRVGWRCPRKAEAVPLVQLWPLQVQ